ncbi:hypothetical protein [Streptomyces melanogenes]|nr:hypothetical protein [Streptomyces melanogenes]
MPTTLTRLLVAKAIAAGFASMAAAIDATRSLPSRETAARTGVGASTITR